MLGFAHWAGILLAAAPAALNLGIVAYVLRRIPRNALTYTFVLFVLAMATWQGSEACTRIVATSQGAEACRGFLFSGGLLVAPLGMHFALLFTDRRHMARSPAALALLYGPALLFEALNRAGLNEARLAHHPLWGWQQQPPPPLVSVAFSYWVVLLTFGTLAVLMAFASRLPADDDRKPQARLVASGLAAPLVIGTALQVVLPTVLHMPSIPVTSAALTLFSIATVVALQKHRFLALPTIEERLEEVRLVVRRQAALLEEAERMANLGSWEWDVAANEVHWSPQLHRIFGVDPTKTEATYAAYMDRVHPSDRERVAQAVSKALETGQGFSHDHRIQRPDGGERIVHARGRTHADDAGHVDRMTGTVQDVTEQRQAQVAKMRAKAMAEELDRLQAMDRLKTTFLNAAAHELYTPLTPIVTTLYTLRAKAEQTAQEDVLRELDRLDRNAERLRRLVENLLEASRLDSKKEVLDVHPVQLDKLVSDAVESSHDEAVLVGVTLRAVVDGPVELHGDPERLTQVVSSLLSNAFKFTPRGGDVTITASTLDEDVVVEVRDTGIGMDEETQERIFEPFSRAHVEAPGVGLGLYIAKGIVELHGGEIECRSKGPGKGTTFTVILPKRPPGVFMQAVDEPP